MGSAPLEEPYDGGLQRRRAGRLRRHAELERFAQLKAQGILTEEEFEAKKKQILGI